jgi:hypothetical protein
LLQDKERRNRSGASESEDAPVGGPSPLSTGSGHNAAAGTVPLVVSGQGRDGAPVVIVTQDPPSSSGPSIQLETTSVEPAVDAPVQQVRFDDQQEASQPFSTPRKSSVDSTLTCTPKFAETPRLPSLDTTLDVDFLRKASLRLQAFKRRPSRASFDGKCIDTPL